ncbi:MAG TPA: inorganic phosphate transporter [bacterium]|mgnify:CR=1 FL=1|nr:inorganic phosphate transporter [bacterium]HPN36378.1 inorganic phosphate transporter [bacterium]
MWPFTSGAVLGWALGANDASNVFGTAVATRLIRFRTAAILLIIFLLIGAVHEGPKCMTTVNAVAQTTATTAFLATLSAGVVMLIMSVLALPASSSQAVIGALLFIGCTDGAPDWGVLVKIGLCWLLTPVSAGLLSALLYAALGVLMRPLISHVIWRTAVLRYAVILTGCYGAYSLGSNNVANVFGVYVGAGMLSAQSAAVYGGLTIALGVATYSRKVMMTVGRDIVPLDAFSAFISVLALAISTHLFTQIGVPVSSTQAVVGSVLGLGVLKDSSKINMKIVGRIVSGWVATPLAGWLVCLLLFTLMNVFI